MGDIALILAYTTASCVGVGLAGLGAFRLLRRRTLRLAIVLAAVIPVLAVTVSVLANVRAMFLSGHDSVVVLVALGWATVIAVTMTMMVGRLFERGSHALRQGLRELDGATLATSPEPATAHEPRVARGPAPVVSGSLNKPVPPAELAMLVAELDSIRQRLIASRSRERALETSRRELVTFMSHDLRTPLTGLRVLAEALDDGVIDDVPAAMGRIRGYVDRMTLLVDDLFELSRVTSRDVTRPRRLVSLAEVAMDVVAETGDLARSRGVELKLELATGSRLPVLGDADELARAIGNLVVNAVRHTEPGGVVHVMATREGDRAQVSVTDGCGGIPGADLPFVFDAGWRGSPDRTPDDGGAGFGLAIARGVAESHAGQLTVTNVDGGCRFELDLPSSPASQLPSPSPPN